MKPIFDQTLRLILIILTCYRISELIVLDDGPYEIFKRFRLFMGRIQKGGLLRQIALMINCPFCVGVWLSIALSFLFFFPTFVGDVFLVVFGISGGQCALESFGARWNR